MREISVREPIQKRSIDKKNKILDHGFKLICEKGYHNTNTAEIAKAAGVSTGIVYSYFKDKHDILIQGYLKFKENFFLPLFDEIFRDYEVKDIGIALHEVVQVFVTNYEKTNMCRKELSALASSDEEIAMYLEEEQIALAEKIYELLIKKGFDGNELKETIFISLNLIYNYCETIVDHNYTNIDYEIVEKKIIDFIKNSIHKK